MIYINPNSTIDYPGKTAAVLFLPGCNLRCPYCHNPELAIPAPSAYSWEDNDVFMEILLRLMDNKLLSGVVITGGEPTLHADIKRRGDRRLYLTENILQYFCDTIKEKTSLPIKLDTNGTRPDVISELIERKLIDYVAMSLKPHVEDPYLRCRMKKTYTLIKNSTVDYEFRVVAVADRYGFNRYHFDAALERDSRELYKVFGKIKLNLHRHNRDAKILQPEFYKGVKLYDESDYQRLADMVRSQGLECEVV